MNLQWGWLIGLDRERPEWTENDLDRYEWETIEDEWGPYQVAWATKPPGAIGSGQIYFVTSEWWTPDYLHRIVFTWVEGPNVGPELSRTVQRGKSFYRDWWFTTGKDSPGVESKPTTGTS